jgi:hypothetical protein
MLLAHVRNCQNKACPTCHKLRERIRQSRAHQQHQHGMHAPMHVAGSSFSMAMQVRTGDIAPRFVTPLIERKANTHVRALVASDPIRGCLLEQGSYNPLVSSSSGFLGGGWNESWSGGLGGQGPLYAGHPGVRSLLLILQCCPFDSIHGSCHACVGVALPGCVSRGCPVHLWCWFSRVCGQGFHRHDLAMVGSGTR